MKLEILILLTVSALSGCVAQVPIRVAESDVVGLEISAMPAKMLAEQELGDYLIRESMNTGVMKESDVRAEIEAIKMTKVVEKMRVRVQRSAAKDLGWPTPKVDPGCQSSGLAYCLNMHTAYRVSWRSGWLMNIQTQASLIQKSDGTVVWRHAATRGETILGSQEGVSKPVQTWFEAKTPETFDELMANLKQTIKQRNAAPPQP